MERLSRRTPTANVTDANDANHARGPTRHPPRKWRHPQSQWTTPNYTPSDRCWVRHPILPIVFVSKKCILTHPCAFLGVNSKNEDRGLAGFCRPNCRGTLTLIPPTPRCSPPCSTSGIMGNHSGGSSRFPQMRSTSSGGLGPARRPSADRSGLREKLESPPSAGGV